MTTIAVVGNRLQKDGVNWTPIGWNSVAGLYSTHYKNSTVDKEYFAAYTQLLSTVTPTSFVVNGNQVGPTLWNMAQWGCNAVRLQVIQRELADSAYAAAYITRIQAVVTRIQSAGMIPILCMQDNLSANAGNGNTRDKYGKGNGEGIGITAETVAAWQALATHFGSDHGIIFEAFNETPYALNPSGTALWKAGSQSVATAIRAISTNVILLGGPHHNTQWDHIVLGDLITGSNIGYTIHAYTSPHARDRWYENWGWISDTFPVVATEWNSYSSQTADKVSAHPWLHFARLKNIGVIGWVFDHYTDANELLNQTGASVNTSDYSQPWTIVPTTSPGTPITNANFHATQPVTGLGSGQTFKTWATHQSDGLKTSGGSLTYCGIRIMLKGWNSTAACYVPPLVRTPTVYPTGKGANLQTHLQFTAPGAPTTAAMQKWGTYIVRLQLVSTALHTSSRTAPTSTDVANYIAYLHTLVDICHAAGYIVILSMATTGAGVRQPIDQSETDASQFGANVNAAWTSLAPAFASDPLVVYDMLNEPCASYTSGGGHQVPYSWQDWHDKSLALYNLIRGFAANNLILVEANAEWAGDLSGASGFLLGQQGGDGTITNVVYEMHGYGDLSGPEKNYDKVFGWVQKDGHAPLIMGEWYRVSTNPDHGKDNAFLNYAEKIWMGVLGWVFDQPGDETMAIITNPDFTPIVDKNNHATEDSTFQDPWLWWPDNYANALTGSDYSKPKSDAAIVTAEDDPNLYSSSISFDSNADAASGKVLKTHKGSGEHFIKWLSGTSPGVRGSVPPVPPTTDIPVFGLFELRIWSKGVKGELLGETGSIAGFTASRVEDATGTFSVQAFLTDPQAAPIAKGQWVELWVGRYGPPTHKLWAAGTISQITKSIDGSGTYQVDFDDASMFLAEWRCSDGATMQYPQYSHKATGFLSILNGLGGESPSDVFPVPGRSSKGHMGLLPPGWKAVWVDQRKGNIVAPTVFTVSSATFAAQSGPGLPNVATYTTTTPHGYSVGNLVSISGMLPIGYNGVWPILSIPSDTTFNTNTPVHANSTQGGTVVLAKAPSPSTPPGWGESWNAALDTGLNSLDNICAHFNIHWRLRPGSTEYNGVVEVGPLYDSANLGIWGGDALRTELARREGVTADSIGPTAILTEAYLAGISVTTTPQFHETLDNIWNIIIAPGKGTGANEVTLASFWEHAPDHQTGDASGIYDPVAKVFRPQYFYELYQPYPNSRQYFVRDKKVAHWSGNLYELVAWVRQDGTWEYGVMNRTSVEKYGPKEGLLSYGNKKITDPDSLLTQAISAVDENADPVPTWVFPAIHPRLDPNGIPPLVLPGQHLGIKYQGMVQPTTLVDGELVPYGDLIYADYNGAPEMKDSGKKIHLTRVKQIDEVFDANTGFSAVYTMGHGKYRPDHWERNIGKQLEDVTKVDPSTGAVSGQTLDGVPIIHSKYPTVSWQDPNRPNSEEILNPDSWVMTNTTANVFLDHKLVHFDFEIHGHKQIFDFIFLRPMHYKQVQGILIAPSGVTNENYRDFYDVSGQDWGFYMGLRIPMKNAPEKRGGFFKTVNGQDWSRKSWFATPKKHFFPWEPGHFRVTVAWTGEGGKFEAWVRTVDKKQKNGKPYVIGTAFSESALAPKKAIREDSTTLASEIGWHLEGGTATARLLNVDMHPTAAKDKSAS